jgi:hypothetical protein
MDSRQRAIARIRAFFEPPTQFRSGTKVHEPKPGDSLASIKRQIKNFALKAAESDKPYTPAEMAAIENKLKEYRATITATITDAEVNDYLELLCAVEKLVAADTNPATPSV